MVGAYINTKLIIWNRESESGNWFLVHYLSKRVGYFKTDESEQRIGNRELVPFCLLWHVIPMFRMSQSGIRN